MAPRKPEPVNPRTLSKRRRDTRARILTGAVEALGQGGAATTVEDILAAASVSRRTFYQYFRDLDEVSDVLVDQVARFTRRATREAMERPTPVERIDALIEMFYVSQREVADFLRVVLGESQNPASRSAAIREQLIDEISRTVAAVFGREDEIDLFRTLFLMCEAAALHALRAKRNWRQEHERAQATVRRIFVTMLGLDPAGTKRRV